MKTTRLSKGLVFSILAASASSLVPAATFTSVATGNWGNPLSWDVGVGFPNTYTTDSAIISATQTISYDGSIPTLGGNLVVANGNSITINGGALVQTWVPGAPPPFGTTIAIGATNAGGTGAGTLNINGGGSFTSGTANAVAVGVTQAALAGGPSTANGVANINEGTMTLSAAASGSSGGQGLAVGINAGGTGVLNVGDGAGAADSSVVNLATNNVTLTVGGTNGEGAGNGTMNIKSDGRVTTGTARAYIGDGGTGTVLVDGGTFAVGGGSLTVGANGGNGTLNVAGGLATIDGPGGGESFIVANGAGSVGTVTVSGGTLNSVSNILIGMNGGIGTFNQTGGTVTYNGWAAVGYGAGAAGSSYNISGGLLSSAAGFEVGADRAGLMTISGTATVNISEINVGIRANGEGTLNISGGTTTVGTIGFGGAQATSTGTGTISGGAVNATNVYVGRNNGGSGTLNISGGTTNVGLLGVGGGIGTSNGVLNITGGTNTITGGGQSFIGRGAGSTGTVNINGAALSNTSGGDYQIGYQGGTGNLNITNGGTFTHNWWLNVARDAGSVGNVTIAGAGSSIALSGGDARTNIGEDGTGSLIISGGGAFSSQSEVSIGRNNGSNGSLAISGGGSFSTSGEIAIGRNGGSTGTVTMTGATSSISLTGGDRHLYVGLGGQGTYNQSGGTLNLNGNRVQIADQGGSTGTVNISGGSIINSQWFHVGSGGGATGNLNVNFTNPADSLTTGALYVGNGGSTGNMTVSNGRVNANDTVQVGRYGGGTGTLTVTGPNSIVSAYHAGGDDFVRVGMENGNGTVNVLAGGKFTTNNSWFTIGMQDGSTGTTTVSGAGSELTSRGLIVGWNGNSDGTLNISDGAVVNNRDREVSIGRDYNNVSLATSPRGIVNVGLGGTLNAGTTMRVGHNTTGFLNINGGTVNAGDTFIAGDGGAANGTVNMNSGTLNFQSGWARIGQNGTGSLNLNGGTINSSDWTVVANEVGSHGTMNITGGTFNVNGGGDSGRLITARLGTAVVNQSGGTVNVGNWFAVAIDPGSNGTYNLSGGTLNTRNEVVIGNNNSTGAMTMTGGSTFNVAGGGTTRIGGDNNANGTMTVSGSGTVFNANNQEFRVGGGGNTSTGTLNIVNGGVVNFVSQDGNNASQNGNFGVAENANGTGTINMNNGTLNVTAWSLFTGWNEATSVANINMTNSTINIFRTATDPGGSGHLFFGDRGVSTLRQEGGLISAAGWSAIGRERGGDSTYNLGVNGGGGTFNVGESLYVGRQSHGTINMGAGTTITVNGELSLAQENSPTTPSSGVINNNGGLVQVNGPLHLARNNPANTASYNQTSGQLIVNEVQVGRDGATAFFNMSGGTALVNGNIDVGRNSNGTFTMTGGTTQVNGSVNPGHEGNGNGTVQVTGGTLNINGNLDVANGGGDSVVTVSGGATVNMGAFYVGTNAGSVGIVNVTNGTLNLGGWSEIGRYGGQATVNINGANAIFDGSGNDMQIGHQGGTGTVNILNGGQFTHNWWINLGRDGGTGNMLVSGANSRVRQTNNTDGNGDSRFNIGGDPNGSVNNHGVLTISNGGLVERTAGGGEVNIGRKAGSDGVVNITSGGQFTNVGGITLIGFEGATGTVNIDGVGSRYVASTIGDDFHRVGQGGGNGTLNITNGAKWSNSGWFTIGQDSATGYVKVDGAGSELSTSNGLIVGWSGASNATLDILNGAVVNSTGREVSVGRDQNNTVGLIKVNGAGSTLNGRDFRIGGNGQGTVNIGGGTVNSQGGWFFVGQGNGSQGTINMSGGALNTNDSVFVGVDAGATGTINQTGGATNVGNEFMLGGSGSTGSLNLSGGTFNVNGWTILGGRRDGGAGTGTINITNGAKFTHLQTGGDLLAGWQNGSVSTINILSGGTMEYNWWARFGVDAGSTSTMTISGAGSKFEQGTVAADTRFFVGEGGTGTINVTNRGLLKVRNGLIFGGSSDEVKSGTGTLNVGNGTVKVGGELNFGYRAGSTGNLAISNGTVTNNSFLIIGRAGAGNYTQNGGRVWNTDQELRIGNDGTGVGTMTVNNGTLNSFGNGVVGESGTGTLNVNGGIVGIGCCTGGNMFIGHLNGSSGTVTVTGGILDVGGSVEFNTQGGATVSVLNLNGGILATDFINNPTGNAVAKLNADGGTLRATQNESNFIRGMAAGRLNLNAGGLTIDTNSFTVTSNAIFSGDGGLAKGGFGQLNITNNQVYLGETGVTAGVLNLDFTASGAPNNLVPNSGLALGGGTLRVNTSVTLANAQNFTGTTINSGSSRIEIVDNGGTGTINLGAIARNPGGTVDVGTVGTVNTTDANVNGILGKGLTVNGNNWGKNDGTGKIVAAVGADYSAAFGAANNLDAAAPITGGGAVNSIKASANITLDADTTIGSGGILIPSTAGNVTIASAAAQTLTSGNGLDLVVIQNSAAGVATIASKITGAGIALTKSGNGTLVLGNAANDYDGGTFINSGALVIGADSALGNEFGGITLAAPSLASGGVLAVTDTMTLGANRTVTLNSGGGGFSVPATKTLTIGQDISGAGGLGKVGAGALVLGGNNTYTGETAIFEGSLQLNGAITGTAGFTADGSVTLGSGANITSSGAFQIARNAGPTVAITGDAVTLSGKEFTIGGSGNANVTLTGASTLAASCDLFVARLNGSTSSLDVTGGAVIVQGGMVVGAAGGATGTATVTNGSLTVSRGLTVGNGGTGTLNLAGSTSASFRTLDIGAGGGGGTLNISGSASLTGTIAQDVGFINVGSSNSGAVALNQSGGSVSFNSWMTIGLGGGSNDPANSQYNLSGGTLSSPAGIELGSDHGGTMTISNTGAAAVGNVSIGHRSTGNGVLNVTGGTLTTNEITVGNNVDSGGGAANGVMNLSGGVTTVNGSLFVARNSGGGGSSGTVNLDGGELKVNAISRGAGAFAQLNFNGTVIKPNAATGNFISGFDTTSVDVKAGGAIFNTDGKDIGVSTALDGVGALTKTGNGKLTLAGNSSYVGGVNLNTGTLSVRNNNALGTGTVVGNGGILSFDNASGNGLIEGRLSGAFNTTDAIPFDAVQLGTPKAHETNPANFPDNTTYGYRGTLVVPAGPDVTWTFGKQFDDSVRLLIDGNQLINDGTWNNAVVATVTLAAGEHSFEARFGEGGGGVGPNSGWTIGFGIDTLGRNVADPSFFTALTDPGDGSRLRYSDGGSADYTVPNGMTLNVATEIYVRQFGAGINGDITGAAGINKTGNGRLTLAGTNSYAGPTNINAGVLEIGNGGATGSLGSGNVNNAGTLKFNRTGTLNVPNIISGVGPVQQNGLGTTILAGLNTYTGPTTVNAGNLQVTGSISGSITTVNVNGTLSGTGTVGTVMVNGGTLAPGASPGILNSGNITFSGGALSVELNGTTVGTLYDQLNVTGSVTLQSNVALAINFGYSKQIGDSFTIINNDALDAIGGAGRFTFAGTPLQDGDLFSDFGNDTSLLIDYTAGSDNNDVVLTVVPEPGSLVMLMGGLAMLAGVRRRRQ